MATTERQSIRTGPLVSSRWSLLVAAILAALTAGKHVAAQESPAVPRSIENVQKSIDLASNKEGGLVFSATYSGNLDGAHHLVFGPTGGGASSPEFSVASNPSGESPDWRQEGKDAAAQYTGRLVVITLPPGEYELRRHMVVPTRGAPFYTLRNMRYSFAVKPGSWVYLGNIHANFRREQANAYLVRTYIADERFRDLPLLQSRYTNIAEKHVIVDLREVGEIDSRFGPTMDDLGGLLPKPGAAGRQEDRVMKDLHDLRDLLPK
jgi:hypothetical protein